MPSGPGFNRLQVKDYDPSHRHASRLSLRITGSIEQSRLHDPERRRLIDIDLAKSDGQDSQWTTAYLIQALVGTGSGPVCRALHTSLARMRCFPGDRLSLS
jgi:hypothetical protein